MKFGAPESENSQIIYSLSCYSKPIKFKTQIKMFLMKPESGLCAGFRKYRNTEVN